MRLQLPQNPIHGPIKTDARTTMFLAPQVLCQLGFLQIVRLGSLGMAIGKEQVVVCIGEVGVDDDDVGGDFLSWTRAGGRGEVDPLGALARRVGGHM